MESAELELAFYRDLLANSGNERLHPPHRAGVLARMLGDPAPLRVPLQGDRTAIFERVGGRDAKWRVQIAAQAGATEEFDARALEERFDTGWSWLRTAQTHALERQILDHALERSAHPVFVIDSAGSVLMQNGAARDLLRTCTTLRIEGGRLCRSIARRPIDSQYLAAHGSANVETGAHATLALCDDRAAQSTMFLEARCLTPDLPLPTSPHAVWLINVFAASANRRLSARALRQLLGLTCAEAEVTQALFEGRRAGEVASARAVSRETIKKHLSSVFRKCKVGSQAELMRLIALGPFFCAPGT